MIEYTNLLHIYIYIYMSNATDKLFYKIFTKYWCDQPFIGFYLGLSLILLFHLQIISHHIPFKKKKKKSLITSEVCKIFYKIVFISSIILYIYIGMERKWWHGCWCGSIRDKSYVSTFRERERERERYTYIPIPWLIWSNPNPESFKTI